MSSKLLPIKWDSSNFTRSSHARLDSTYESHIRVKAHSSRFCKLPKDKFKHRRRMPPPEFHTAGGLEDMAPSGTSVAGDVGIQRTIPSVPRSDHAQPSLADFSHSNPAHATDNTFDAPRGTRERGTPGEVTTAFADQLPGNVEKKHFDGTENDPRAMAHGQYAKQMSGYDATARAGHDVEGASGEKDVEQEGSLDRRGAK